MIVAINSKPEKYEDNAKQVLSVLQNPEFTDGTFKIKCKVKYRGETDEFLYNKGDKQTAQPMAQSNLNLPNDFAAAMDHPAIKLQTEITRLELENDDLNRQIEELNDYIKDLEEKISTQTLSEIPAPPSNFETAKSFLTELATMAAPLIDQHYALKAQQLEIERARLNSYTPPAPSAYKAPEVKKEMQLETKIKNWINSKQNDTELYNNLIAIYYNSSDLRKFAELLNEFNPDLYDEAKRTVG
jgi:TolA-binding protein